LQIFIERQERGSGISDSDHDGRPAHPDKMSLGKSFDSGDHHLFGCHGIRRAEGKKNEMQEANVARGMD